MRKVASTPENAKSSIKILDFLWRENNASPSTANSDESLPYTVICIGYHMRGEVISVLLLEGQYHIVSRVSAANEGQNMIS